MRSAVLAVLLATGCRSVFGLENATALDGSTSDDAPGDATDAPVVPDGPAANCFGTLFPVCLRDLPTQPFTLNINLTFNSDSPISCADTTNEEAAGYCVFAATSYTISSGVTLNLFGSKPVVIIATTGDLTISGTLDAASELANPNNPAPGSDPAGGCDPGTASVGAGGAAGGSFGAKGGNGARSNQGGPGGISGAIVTPTALRGGCKGGDGDTALGGRGGGGIMLISTTTVRITGSIDASGAGGHGGPAGNHGGGGGGSGGMIVVDAPMIESPGQVWANGGGGGGGSNSGTAGGDGKEPLSAAQVGAGGPGGGAAGGEGGAGSHGGTGVDALNGGGDAGGGGGGGGAGLIRFRVAATGSTPSPTPQIGP